MAPKTPTKVWNTNDYDAAVKAMSAELKVDADALRITIEEVDRSSPDLLVKVTVSAVVGGKVAKSISGIAGESVLNGIVYGGYDKDNLYPRYSGGKTEIQIYKPEVVKLKKIKEDADKARLEYPQLPNVSVMLKESILPKINVIDIEPNGQEHRRYLKDLPRVSKAEDEDKKLKLAKAPR